jgi:hypothetical protein
LIPATLAPRGLSATAVMALPIRVLFISSRRRKVVIDAARFSSWIGVMTAERMW